MQNFAHPLFLPDQRQFLKYSSNPKDKSECDLQAVTSKCLELVCNRTEPNSFGLANSVINNSNKFEHRGNILLYQIAGSKLSFIFSAVPIFTRYIVVIAVNYKLFLHQYLD